MNGKGLMTMVSMTSFKVAPVSMHCVETGANPEIGVDKRITR